MLVSLAMFVVIAFILVGDKPMVRRFRLPRSDWPVCISNCIWINFTDNDYSDKHSIC